MNIWVLAIDTRYGIDITAYDSFELAFDVLFHYVAENWDEDCMEKPLPEDPREAIEEYFDMSHEDTYYLESAIVQKEAA